MAEYDIAVIGGDKRTACMIPFFMERGHRVIGYKVCHKNDMDIEADGYADSLKQAVEAAPVIVGGIPIEKKGIVNLKELSRHIRKYHKIFGGIIPEAFRQECSERGIACYDFMKDENVAVFNAIATAEGAVLEALLHKQTNIHHSRSLVLGYGRCGKVLSGKLKGLSAYVTVCSNNAQELAMAEAFGMEVLGLKDLGEEIAGFEYIYNTIPAVILDEEMLKKIRKDALIIDIASGRGGLDYKEAEARQIKALHCLGLPGKYAGEISAKCLSEYVLSKCLQRVV
ncbi:MAG TPA: dipicolinate synthase [Lachnospiraceae bacterium]|nr:dipicolinate synthase [Lachnospiraceae bacterium]